MSRSHDCLGDCGTRLRTSALVCRPCARRLPYAIQDALARWTRSRSERRAVAIHDASAWFHDHPRSPSDRR